MALTGHLYLAEEERFELSRELAPPYSFSKAAPSATWVLLHVEINYAHVTVRCFQSNYRFVITPLDENL